MSRLCVLAGVVCLSLGLSFVLSPSADAVLVPYNFSSLTEKSDVIVRGKVSKIRSYYGKFSKLDHVLLTDVTIDVSEVWKGTVPSAETSSAKGAKSTAKTNKTTKRTVTIQLLGGQIGRFWQHCPESPDYEVGENVVVFARKWNERLWTTGWLQGKYRVQHDQNGVHRIYGKEGAPLPDRLPIADLKKRVAERLELLRVQEAARQKAERELKTNGGSR